MVNQLINKLIHKYKKYVLVIIHLKLEQLIELDKMQENEGIVFLEEKSKSFTSNGNKGYQPTLFYSDF